MAIGYQRCFKNHHATLSLEETNPILTQPAVLQKLQFEDILMLTQQLPPSFQRVFELYILKGYSHKEIGEQLGIKANTSKVTLAKARIQLKQLLANL